MTKLRRPLLPVLVAALACAGGSAPAGQTQDERLVGINPLEFAYIYLASELAASGPRHRYYTGPDSVPAAVAVCERISPRATELTASWGGFDSWSFEYARSACFHQVAVAGKAPDICDRLTPLEATPARILVGARRRVTVEQCQQEAMRDGGGGGEFGSEVLLSLLGYSREQMTSGADGVAPEHGGAYEFKQTLLVGGGGDGQDYSRFEDLLGRVTRLPDFSRDEPVWRGQTSGPFPGGRRRRTHRAWPGRCAAW